MDFKPPSMTVIFFLVCGDILISDLFREIVIGILSHKSSVVRRRNDEVYRG